VQREGLAADVDRLGRAVRRDLRPAPALVADEASAELPGEGGELVELEPEAAEEERAVAAKRGLYGTGVQGRQRPPSVGERIAA
jgi:hypothetical protein